MCSPIFAHLLGTNVGDGQGRCLTTVLLLGSFHPSFMVQYSLVVVLVFDNLLNGRHADESQKWLGATERKASEQASKTAEFERFCVLFVRSFIHTQFKRVRLILNM
jgi:hypothetical protein